MRQISNVRYSPSEYSGPNNPLTINEKRFGACPKYKCRAPSHLPLMMKVETQGYFGMLCKLSRIRTGWVLPKLLKDDQYLVHVPT